MSACRPVRLVVGDAVGGELFQRGKSRRDVAGLRDGDRASDQRADARCDAHQAFVEERDLPPVGLAGLCATGVDGLDRSLQLIAAQLLEYRRGLKVSLGFVHHRLRPKRCVLLVERHEFAFGREPRLLNHTQSAVTPISALTAWQGLLEKTNVQRGQRVLVHGAAGGVGVFAVQLARWRGAHVIATASAANLDFVRKLGAEQVMDYRTTRFEEIARDIDVVFDTVGGETLERSWGVLKPDGRLVTIAAGGAQADKQRVRDAFLLVRADGCQLSQIAGLIDAGELRVFVEATFPLTRARAAYRRAQRGKMRGKIALQVAE
jgi:hypothetical protein